MQICTYTCVLLVRVKIDDVQAALVSPNTTRILVVSKYAAVHKGLDDPDNRCWSMKWEGKNVRIVEGGTEPAEKAEKGDGVAHDEDGRGETRGAVAALS